MEVDLVVVADELEDGDVEAAGERDAVLRHADGVVLGVWAATGRQTEEWVGFYRKWSFYQV